MKGDVLAQALFLGRLAFMLSIRGDFDDAWNCTEQALGMTPGPEVSQAWSLAMDAKSLILLWGNQPDRGKALEVREEALATHRAVNDVYWITTDLLVVGQIATEMKDYPRADQCLKEALCHARAIGFKKGEGQILGQLGILHIERGDSDLSETDKYLNEALSIAADWKDKRAQTLATWYLSKLESQRRNTRIALKYANEAREMALRLGMKRETRRIGEDLAKLQEQIKNASFIGHWRPSRLKQPWSTSREKECKAK